MKNTDSTVREADTLTKEITLAIAAVLDKKALDVVVLDLRELSAFTDYFVICSGTSIRQVQAISDAVEERLRAESHSRAGGTPGAKVKPRIEGYREGEWVLMDFGDFLVHIFTESKREYFDLERLWGDATRVPVEGAAEPVSRRKRKAAPDTH